MLISCYQCRQQLDVPEDSAGKRVRCPHCQYVIVAPASAKSAGTEAAPALGLPSMELEAEGDRPVTKVAPLPLPKFDPVPSTPIPPIPNSSQSSRGEQSSRVDDDHDVPSIERGGRRGRAPLRSPGQSGGPVRWGRILGIGTVVVVIVCGIICGVISSSNRARHKQQFVFKERKDGPMPGPAFKDKVPGVVRPFNVWQAVPYHLWQNVQRPDHRFQALFPGMLAEKQVLGMTAFEARCNQGDVQIDNGPGGPNRREQTDWIFTIAHAPLTRAQYEVPLQNRHEDVHIRLSRAFAPLGDDGPRDIAPFAGVHPTREWDYSLMNNRRLYSRSLFVRDGDSFHHYVLLVNVPGNIQRQHVDVQRFFSSFQLLPGQASKQLACAELDTRRDNEFTALALHPTRSMLVSGSSVGQLRIGPRQVGDLPGAFTIHVPDGKPIDELRISPSGRWMAVAVAGRIEYWQNWIDGFPAQKFSMPGVRCAFVHENRLLVADKDELREYDLSPHKLVSTHRVPDTVLRGLALSPDGQTLATFGDKTLAFHQWKDKALLGKVEAHAGAINAAVFSPNGKTLASAGADRTIKLWNADTRTERADLKQHAWSVSALAFTPDGKHLVSGGLDGMVLVWNVDQAAPTLTWAQGHQFPIRAVAFDKDGQNLYVTCKQQAGINPAGIRQFSRQVRKIAWADIKHNAADAERAVAQQAGLHLSVAGNYSYFTPDGTSLVTAEINNFNDNNLGVWDLATGRLRLGQRMQNVGVLSPDGKWFVSATQGGANQLQILDVQSGRLTMPGVFFTPSFNSLLFSADGKSLWVHRNSEFFRYDVREQPGTNPMLVQSNKITLKKPNDGGGYVIYPSVDLRSFLVERTQPIGTVRTRTLYSTADGKIVPMPQAPAGEWSAHLRLRVNFSRLELEDILHGHSRVVGQQNGAIFPETLDWPRQRGATSQRSFDNKLRINLWDLKERRPILSLPEGRAQSLMSLRFSPDGKQLAIVSNDAWTRIVPTDWLLERTALLPCPANEVAGP